MSQRSGRKWHQAVTVVLLLFASETLYGDEPQAASQTAMQAKLTRTRNLLQALVEEDFSTIAAEAKEMAVVTRQAAWMKDESPAYQAESFEFESTLHLLRELAGKENSQGVALAYVTLTLNCVDCHRTIREGSKVTLGDITVPSVAPTSPEESSEASVWMRRKLETTQQILSGLVSRDFDLLHEAAESMQTISKAEGWVRQDKIPGYATHLASFIRACEQLEQGATDENIEASALAHTQLVLSCVNCHADLRDRATQ